MIGDEHIVRFDIWCEKCEHYNKSEFDYKSECYACMFDPVNTDDRRPTKFKESVDANNSSS